MLNEAILLDGNISCVYIYIYIYMYIYIYVQRCVRITMCESITQLSKLIRIYKLNKKFFSRHSVIKVYFYLQFSI